MQAPEYPPDEVNEDDEILDQLSPWTRNQILEELHEATFVRAYVQWSRRKRILWWFEYGLAMIWGMILALIALIACLTIIGIPVGIVILSASGLPGALLINKRMRYVQKIS